MVRSTRTRWPESGHHPTTLPGTSSPCRRSASTRVTRASSARTEPRRGPDSTTRCALAERTSARPRSASNAEWGLSHQWSRPTTGGEGNRDQSRAHHSRVAQVTASAPTAARPAGERPSTQRSSCVAEELPSRTQREDSANRFRTASRGERAEPASIRRTAATPMDRRAVREDQANGCPGPRSRASSMVKAVRTS
jgi:hypothetical protein